MPAPPGQNRSAAPPTRRASVSAPAAGCRCSPRRWGWRSGWPALPGRSNPPAPPRPPARWLAPVPKAFRPKPAHPAAPPAAAPPAAFLSRPAAKAAGCNRPARSALPPPPGIPPAPAHARPPPAAHPPPPLRSVSVPFPAPPRRFAILCVTAKMGAGYAKTSPGQPGEVLFTLILGQTFRPTSWHPTALLLLQTALYSVQWFHTEAHLPASFLHFRLHSHEPLHLSLFPVLCTWPSLPSCPL